MQDRSIVVIDPKDNVATAVKPIKAGQVIVPSNSPEAKVRVLENISPGHKVALKDLKAGEVIIKFGEPIAKATVTIRQGAWVHTHNVESVRAETASSQ